MWFMSFTVLISHRTFCSFSHSQLRSRHRTSKNNLKTPSLPLCSLLPTNTPKLNMLQQWVFFRFFLVRRHRR